MHRTLNDTFRLSPYIGLMQYVRKSSDVSTQTDDDPAHALARIIRAHADPSIVKQFVSDWREPPSALGTASNAPPSART